MYAVYALGAMTRQVEGTWRGVDEYDPADQEPFICSCLCGCGAELSPPAFAGDRCPMCGEACPPDFAFVEVVGPLEQRILEILCGKFNKGPWPPPDEAWRKAGLEIENAGGRVSFEDSGEFTTPDDWVNAFAELARDHDEGTCPSGAT